MILRVLAVSMIGFTLAGCVSSSGLSGDVYSASEASLQILCMWQNSFLFYP